MVRSTANNGVKKTITRNRASYSCQCCRKRKVKCDKVHPVCGQCLKNGETCEYGDGTTTVVTLDSGAHDPEPIPIKRRRQEQELFSLPDPNPAPKSAERAVISSSSDIDLEERLTRLTQLLTALRRNSTASAAANANHGRKSASVSDGANGSGQHRTTTTAGISRQNRTPESMSSQSQHSQDHTDIHQNGITHRSHDCSAVDHLPTLTDPLIALRIDSLEQEQKHQSTSPFWAHIDDELQQLYELAAHRHSNVAQAPNGQTFQSSSSEERAQCSYLFQPQQVHAQGNAASLPPHSKTHSSGHCDKAVLLQASSVRKDLASDIMKPIANLLTEQAANVLFRCWLLRVQPVLPFLATLPILIKHQAFWTWSREGRLKGRPLPDMNYMPMLCAMWYLGVTSMPLDALQKYFPNDTRDELRVAFHDQVVHFLQQADFPLRATLQTLSAYVMILSIPLREENPLQAATYLGLAVKSAQMLGLHRDPANLGDFSSMECDLRIRLWWHIVDLDVNVSLSIGMPPQIPVPSSDTPMPLELREDYKDTDEGKAYVAALQSNEVLPAKADDPYNMENLSLVSASMMAFRARCLAGTTAMRILTIHLRTAPIDQDAAVALSQILAVFDSECGDVVNRIPTRGVPEMDFTPNTMATSSANPTAHNSALECSSSFSEPPTFHDLHHCSHQHCSCDFEKVIYHAQKHSLIQSHRFHRIHLSFLSDRLHCIAYAPWLKSAKSRLWHGARQCALRFSFGCMRKFIALSSDPGLDAFRWCLGTLARPLHAVMIVLVDLYERPESKESARGRALVDRVLGLDAQLSEYGVRSLTESWEEAWEMLLSLREKGWRKARLNPDMLWTEADQIRVGVAGTLSRREMLEQSVLEDRVYVDTGGDEANVQITRGEAPPHEVFRALLEKESTIDVAARYVSARPNTSGVCHGHDIQDEPSVSHQPLLRAGPHQPRMPYAQRTSNVETTYANGDVSKPTASPNYLPDPTEHTQTQYMPDAQKTTLNILAYNGLIPESASTTTSLQPTEIPLSYEKNDIDFDWDRWDKVFTSFTELMDFDADMDALHAAGNF